MIPCCHGETHPNRYTSHVILSDDRGEHWKLGGSTGSATDECEVVERSDGSLLLNMRNNCGRKCPARATAVSRDAGLTWSKVEHDPALVEPECQASIRRLAAAGGKGPAILFSNPADAHQRRKMTVRLSRDEGRTWPASKVLWPQAAAYCCLAVLPDGTILCFYERGRGEYPYEKITLARFFPGLAGRGSTMSGAGRRFRKIREQPQHLISLDCGFPAFQPIRFQNRFQMETIENASNVGT